MATSCVTDLPIFKNPEQLIYTDNNGKLAVEKDIIAQLNQIRGPVVVVSMVGMYRTGKSYLLNRLARSPGINGQLKGANGFYMGHTTEAQTKGIWLFAREHPIREGHYMLLLDTEGLEDVNKSDNKHDNWIFCLATLLSSVLCYNDKGVINGGAVRKINFIADMSSQIRTQEDASGISPAAEGQKFNNDIPPDVHFDIFFPQFVYVVRDCDLEPTSDGKEISADEYLENCLDRTLVVRKEATGGSTQHGHVESKKVDTDFVGRESEDKSLQEIDKSKKYIRLYFKERKCFLCTKPASKKKMKQLDETDDCELDEDFVKVATEFCNYVFEKGKAKTLRNQQAFNGRMWGCLAEAFVESVREDKIPCLESAIKKVRKFENSKLVDEYTEKYGKQFSPERGTNGILLKEKVVSEFIEKAIFDYKGDFLQKLLNSIEDMFSAKIQASMKEMQSHQQAVENEVTEAIFKKQRSVHQSRGRAEVEKIKEIQDKRRREKERLIKEKNLEDAKAVDKQISFTNKLVLGIGSVAGLAATVGLTVAAVVELSASGAGVATALGTAMVLSPFTLAFGSVVAIGTAITAAFPVYGGEQLGKIMGFW